MNSNDVNIFDSHTDQKTSENSVADLCVQPNFWDQNELDTSKIGHHIYPKESKKRKIKLASKIFSLQHKLENIVSDYAFMQEENEYLKLEARFWRNKVTEIIQWQKLHMLEEIADYELQAMIASHSYADNWKKERSRKSVNGLDKSLGQLNAKHLRAIDKKQMAQKKREMRYTQESSKLQSIFKDPHCDRSRSRNSSSTGLKVRFKEEESIEDSCELSSVKSATKSKKQSKIIPNPIFATHKDKVIEGNTQVMVKPRKKFEADLTMAHKKIIQQSNKIDKIVDKVVSKGTECLNKEELKIYNTLSDCKLPVMKPVETKRRSKVRQSSSNTSQRRSKTPDSKAGISLDEPAK